MNINFHVIFWQCITILKISQSKFNIKVTFPFEFLTISKVVSTKILFYQREFNGQYIKTNYLTHENIFIDLDN